MRQRDSSTPAPADNPSDAMLLGTLLGEAQEAWYLGGDWRAALRQHAERDGWSPPYNYPPPWPQAFYLMERYVRWAPTAELGLLRMRTTEVPFDQLLWRDPTVRLQVQMTGYLDGLADCDEPGVWVVEFKSSGKWDRFWQLPDEAQTWVYMEAMARLGTPVAGVIYDYTYTCHYKTEQPDEKSFKRLVIRYDEHTAAHYRTIAQEIGKRAVDLELGMLRPVRHIGRGCQWCPFHDACLRPPRPDDSPLAT